MYRVYRDNSKLFVETGSLKFALQMKKEESKKGHTVVIKELKNNRWYKIKEEAKK